MNRDLFLAVLAMDSYHRRYDSGITTNGVGVGNGSGANDWQQIIGSQIGTAAITNVAANADAQSIGFYAAAYDWNGETVISYRGTDDDFAITTASADIWNGYGIGIGRPLGPQAQAAIAFYQDVLATTSGSSSAAVTGHSLGGGLAGFVGALHGLETVVFDNMNFELAAENAYGLAVSGISGYNQHLLDPHIFDPSQAEIDALRNSIYGNQTPWAPSTQFVSSYSVGGELLSTTRVPIPSYETQLDPHASFSVIDPITRHYIPPTILMMYANLSAADRGPDSDDWQTVMPEHVGRDSEAYPAAHRLASRRRVRAFVADLRQADVGRLDPPYPATQPHSSQKRVGPGGPLPGGCGRQPACAATASPRDGPGPALRPAPSGRDAQGTTTP